MNNWLDKRNIINYPCNNYIPKTDNIYLYYKQNEITLFSKYKSSNYMICYKNNYIYIPEDSRRYEIDIIFRKLIDYCLYNKIYDIDNELLINNSIKNSFYKFVYNNSIK
jgi:hypothetical protein